MLLQACSSFNRVPRLVWHPEMEGERMFQVYVDYIRLRSYAQIWGIYTFSGFPQ